jgi:transcriptional regulator with XRE-family HTH domain
MPHSHGAGEALRRAREERRESLRQAAASLTVTASHLSGLERGEKGTSHALTKRAADHCGLDPAKSAPNTVPDDVLSILRKNPELVKEIRRHYDRTE